MKQLVVGAVFINGLDSRDFRVDKVGHFVVFHGFLPNFALGVPEFLGQFERVNFELFF